MVMRIHNTKSKLFLLLNIVPLIFLLFVIILVLSSSLFAEWPPEGLQINPPESMTVYRWSTVSDSAGGAYVGWYHNGNPSFCMVQRIDNEGNFLWEGAGISPADPDSQYYSSFIGMVPAIGGGVIVTYSGVAPDEPYNIMAQRLSPDGERLWGSRGVFMTNSDHSETFPGVFEKDCTIPDGEGGVIQGYVIVNYPPSGGSIHAARVDSSGELVWTGIEVFDYWVYDQGYLLYVQATSDNAGGAIFKCVGNDDAEHGQGVFLQRINSEGELLWPELNRVWEPPNWIWTEEWITMVPWAPGQVMMVVEHTPFNGSKEFYLQHVDEDGEETLNDHGQYIISTQDQAYNAGFDDLAAQNGFLYAPYHDLLLRRLYKFDEEGNQFYEEGGLHFDVREDSSDTKKINIFVRDNRITLIFRSGVFPGRRFTAAQALDTTGVFLWNPYPRELNDGTNDESMHHCQACEIGQDTFFVAWSRYSNIWGTVLYPDGTSGSYPNNPVEEKESISGIPHDMVILNTYPNPFNSSVTIEIESPSRTETAILIYDLLGRDIHEEFYYLSSGNNRIEWKPDDEIPSGIYFISFGSDNFSAQVGKVFLLK